MTTAIAYIPVLHQGYLQFLNNQPIDRLLLLSPEVIPDSIEYLKKELRAVSAGVMQKALQALQIIPQVEVATSDQLNGLSRTDDHLVLPNDDISHALVDQYQLATSNSERVTYSPIFLRWDKKTATETKMPMIEQEVTADELTNLFFDQAYQEAGKSSDWWRHVGCIAVRDGKPMLTGFNQHLPHEQQPYVDGDARALFSAGEQIELTSAIHAEASLIGHAARAGIALNDCELYVTTFPCPPCAKLIAAAGIKKLYFAEGYAMFDGEKILKSARVATTKVKVDEALTKNGDQRSTVVQYPK